MTEWTRPATWADLLNLARDLNAERAHYALIGGYAIAAHGYNRFSEDLDILVDPSPPNTSRWVRALSKPPDHAAADLQGDDEIFSVTAITRFVSTMSSRSTSCRRRAAMLGQS